MRSGLALILISKPITRPKSGLAGHPFGDQIFWSAFAVKVPPTGL
jgi:hypothetical protein